MTAAAGKNVIVARIVVALLLTTGFVALSAAIFHTQPGDALLTHYDTLSGFIATHRFVAIALFAMAYVTIIALCLPGNVIMALTAGVLFGGLTGGAVAVLSSTLGGTIFFAALRAGFAGSIARRAPASIATIVEGFRRDGFFYLLFLRVTPIFPFFVVNIAAALCGIRLSTFVIATVTGIAPVTFSYAFAAAGLEQAIAQQAELFLACKQTGQAACPSLSLAALAGSGFLLPLSVLGLLTILPVLARRLIVRRA